MPYNYYIAHWLEEVDRDWRVRSVGTYYLAQTSSSQEESWDLLLPRMMALRICDAVLGIGGRCKERIDATFTVSVRFFARFIKSQVFSSHLEFSPNPTTSM